MLNLGHFLLRYKRALSFALPAVVCLDACHNAYVVYKLYEEREKVISVKTCSVSCYKIQSHSLWYLREQAGDLIVSPGHACTNSLKV